MGIVELSTLLRPLRRWWWLILVGALLSGAASLVYLLQQPPSYVSRTTLIVGSAITDPNPSGGQINLALMLANSYADMAKREPLRQATMDALGMEWLPEYTAQVLPNTQIIEIQVFAGDPQLIYEVATMLAQQLILQGPAGREQQERAVFVETELSALQASITETRDEIQQKRQELTTLFSAREIDRTQSLIQALENKLSSVQSNYAALLATTQQGASNTLSILERANLPTKPMGSQLGLNIIIAVLLGCTIAASGAYLIEFLDDSFKTATEAQELLGTPVLTSVPTINGDAEESRLITLQTRPARAMEAYRLLRINLEFLAVDHPLKLILVVGATSQDGKSLTAANLASTYARAGKRIILIDADLHRPVQQRHFKLVNNIGLTTALLSNEIAIESLLQPTLVPDLFVLTTGPLPPNPAELLSTQRMRELLAKLRDLADIVIIDSPPLAAVTDGLALATQADGVLMVVRAGKTRRQNAKRAYALLQQVQARLLGIIYNGVAANDSEHLADYGYYRYQRTEFPTTPNQGVQPLEDFELTPQKSNGILTLRKTRR